jgi:hypothetical protein
MPRGKAVYGQRAGLLPSGTGGLAQQGGVSESCSTGLRCETRP